MRQPEEPGRSRVEPWRKRGVLILGLLLSVNVFNFVDRQLPYILVESIRADLRLNDAQIGLMAGLPFAVVYSFASLVVARVADRVSAPLVLSASLAVWSIATTLSGFAQSFLHLIIARGGVAAGESGSNPAAHAIIARLYPAAKRTTVLAVFSLGLPVGSSVGLMLGGWINDTLGWRSAFFVLGLPGVAVAVIAWFCLRDQSVHREPNRSPRGFRGALRHLLSLPSFRHMLIGCGLFAVVFYAVSVFTPAFLIRVHHLGAARVGFLLGALSATGAMLGTLAGGLLADVLGRRDVRWRQLVPACGVTVCIPVALAAWLVHDVNAALFFLAPLYFFSMINAAPTWANIQLLAPDDMRSTATALVQFSAALIGASIGPLVVGMASDLLTPRYGAQSLRYALSLVAIFMAWSGLHYCLAARHMRRDLERGDGGAANYQVLADAPPRTALSSHATART